MFWQRSDSTIAGHADPDPHAPGRRLAAAVPGLRLRFGQTPSEPPVTADTWAVVDGRTITKDATEKAFRRVRDPNETLSAEETVAAKLSVLDDLILQDLLVAKAPALKIDVPAADLDAAFTNARGNLNDEQFKQELTRRSLTEADVRESLRRQLLAEKVLEQEVSKQVAIGDPDVTTVLRDQSRPVQPGRGGVPHRPDRHYAARDRSRQRDRRRRGDAAGGGRQGPPDHGAAEGRRLVPRAGDELFRDPASAQRGGDMGLIPVSQLQQAPPPLRNAVVDKAPGTVNLVSAGNGAFTIVLVVAREPAGQRDLSTPASRIRSPPP